MAELETTLNVDGSFFVTYKYNGKAVKEGTGGKLSRFTSCCVSFVAKSFSAVFCVFASRAALIYSSALLTNLRL